MLRFCMPLNHSTYISMDWIKRTWCSTLIPQWFNSGLCALLTQQNGMANCFNEVIRYFSASFVSNTNFYTKRKTNLWIIKLSTVRLKYWYLFILFLHLQPARMIPGNQSYRKKKIYIYNYILIETVFIFMNFPPCPEKS